MKTSELIGPALDWAVAKCENYKEGFEPFYPDPYDGYGNGPIYTTRNYSTDWAQGGPIIEREKFQIDWESYDLPDTTLGCWVATRWTPPQGTAQEVGPTPLIAAMRCYVASKLGEEVAIPKELE